MRSISLAALVAALVLAGCDHVYFFKAGVTQAEQDRNEDECSRVQTTATESFGMCMAARGYESDIGYRKKK
jgi:hypothetical protein